MKNQRTEFIEKLSAQIVEWETQIDQLKDKTLIATPKEQLESSNAIAALQLKRDKAAAKLQGISGASDAEWEDMKEGADDSWGEIRTILHDTIVNIK